MIEGAIYLSVVITIVGVVRLLTHSAYQKGLAEGYRNAADMLDWAHHRSDDNGQ